MKKLKYILAVVAAILVCLGWMYISAREAEEKPQAYQGVPAEYSGGSNMDGYVIHQFVDDGTFLYILFDEHNGIVNVYDLEGRYQRTLAFYAHLNGAFRIAAEQDAFYVRDKECGLYVFRNGQFEEYLNRNEIPVSLTQLNFDRNAADYEIRDGSVWRVADEEETCVLSRPKASAAYQRNTKLAAGLIVIVLFGTFGWIYRRHGSEC